MGLVGTEYRNATCSHVVQMDTRLHHNYVRELMVTSLDPRTFNEDKKDTIKAEMEELLSTKYAVTRSVSPTMGWDYIYGTGRDLMVVSGPQGGCLLPAQRGTCSRTV